VDEWKGTGVEGGRKGVSEGVHEWRGTEGGGRWVEGHRGAWVEGHRGGWVDKPGL